MAIGAARINTTCELFLTAWIHDAWYCYISNNKQKKNELDFDLDNKKKASPLECFLSV